MSNRLICGVGICDTKATDENGKVLKSYKIWKGMIERSYDPKFHAKYPTYIGTTVSNEWKLYSNFKKFYDAFFVEGWSLDKDLLQEGIENKIYSAKTCLFMPKALNNFLANKYSNNTSGYGGVVWHKRDKKYQAQISTYDYEIGKTKQKHLGLFSDSREASLAYNKAREIQAQAWRDVMIEKHNWSAELAAYIK